MEIGACGNDRYAYSEMNVEGEDIVLTPPNVLTEVMTQRNRNSEESSVVPPQTKEKEKEKKDL